MSTLASHVFVGATFTNNSGRATYTVTELDNRGGFTAKRANNKTFKVTAGRIAKARRLLAEGPVDFRCIDYTVAIEAGAIFALGNEVVVNFSDKTYTAA